MAGTLRTANVAMSVAESAPDKSTAEEHDSYQCARAWVALRSIYSQVNERLVDALDRECGLSVNEFEVLTYLQSAEPRRVRQGDLLDAVSLSQPALSRLVTRLEQQGFIDRIESDDDRRSVLVGLTDAGRNKLAEAIPVHAEAIRRLFLSQMSVDEQEMLVNAFARLQKPTADSR
jgi:DNA-binding MarR family transcriptional regulator